MLDFNNAPEQRSNELIPDGTIASVHMTVRPGGAGDGAWLKRSKAGDSEMLDCEFTVIEGPYAKRKFWTYMTVTGATENHEKAASISAGKIRAMLESAYNVRPDDQSPAAAERRRVKNWGDLDGLRFVAKVGIEKGRDGYKDKNVLAEVITPDRQAWVKIEQTTLFKPVGATAAAAVAQQAAPSNGIKKPSWAS